MQQFPLKTLDEALLPESYRLVNLAGKLTGNSPNNGKMWFDDASL